MIKIKKNLHTVKFLFSLQCGSVCNVNSPHTTSRLGVFTSALVMNTSELTVCLPVALFCQWRNGNDDAVEIGCHLEVSVQCFSSRCRRQPCDENQTNQLETNEEAQLFTTNTHQSRRIDERYTREAPLLFLH